ncbi:heavy metal-binding domain-containing protein [Solitalea koreensis]|uniref:Heavy metal binding domain-containing protein n=1 Tax=Solitalea koreensis TaxID=543615 RepID=A0A521ALE9_9SPHI|nr:heavy metal-binding domain-containing protein [Solitalea koreensis]SMO35636.1 hypothetical protein SAMN06265350_101234 [Solitalea koreensis]
MKTLILLITITFLGITANAQDNTKGKMKKMNKVSTMEVMYICPKCNYMSTKAGTCPHDKVALIKEGTYYCTMDLDQTSDKPGKCAKCGMDLTKMERKDMNDKMEKDSVK